MSDELRAALEARERQVAQLRARLADLAAEAEEATAAAIAHEREAAAQRERAERAEREAVLQRERADALERALRSGGPFVRAVRRLVRRQPR